VITPGRGTGGAGRGERAGQAAAMILECHARIRAFLATARRIAEARGVPDAQVAEAAAAVGRYFTVALPLHAEDEEGSIRPRLQGRDEAIDHALALMAEEHLAHQATVRALATACAELAANPRRLPILARPLLASVAWLEGHFDEHLGGEEAVIIPAMERLLTPEEDAAVVVEMRARRNRS